MASDSIAGVHGWLKSKTAITNIVGTRIYEKELGQNPTYPALSFWSVFDIGGHTHDFSIGPYRDRVQFDCWALNKTDLDALASALRDVFEAGMSGAFGGLKLQGALYRGSREFEEDFRDEKSLETVRRKIVEYEVWYQEILPSNYANTTAWFKADGTLWRDIAQTSLVASNNDPVSVWEDASGNGNHASQIVAGRMPLYKTGIINGLPAVRFDGIDDVLESISIAQSEPQHVYALLNSSNIQAGNRRIFFPNTTTGDPNICYFRERKPATYGVGGFQAEWGVTVQRSAIVRWRFSSSESGIRVDDGSEITDSHGVSTLKTWVSIGHTSGQQPAIDLTEFIIMENPTAQEDAEIMSYLNNRGAIY